MQLPLSRFKTLRCQCHSAGNTFLRAQHLHLFLSMPPGKQLDVLLPMLAFEGIYPHVEPNRARGKAFLPAMRQGHFYNWAWKHGSLHRAANYTPHGDATSDTQGEYCGSMHAQAPWPLAMLGWSCSGSVQHFFCSGGPLGSSRYLFYGLISP